MNHMGGVRTPPGQNRKKCNYLIYFEAFHIKKKMGFFETRGPILDFLVRDFHQQLNNMGIFKKKWGFLKAGDRSPS